MALHVVAAARHQGVYGKATWRTTGGSSAPPKATDSAAFAPPASAPAASSAAEAGLGLGLGLGVGVGVEMEAEVEGGVDVHLMSVGAALAMVHCWLLGLQAQVLQGEALPATLK